MTFNLKMARNLSNLYALFLRGKSSKTQAIPTSTLSSLSENVEPTGIGDPTNFASDFKKETFRKAAGTVDYNKTEGNINKVLRARSSDSYFSNQNNTSASTLSFFSKNRVDNPKKFSSSSHGSNNNGKRNQNEERTSLSDTALPIGVLIFAGVAGMEDLKNQNQEFNKVEAKLWGSLELHNSNVNINSMLVCLIY